MSNQTAMLEELVNDLVGADGYTAALEEQPDGRLRIEIVAGPAACADCLVPKSLLRAVLLDRLPDESQLSESDIVYPSDPRGGAALGHAAGGDES